MKTNKNIESEEEFCGTSYAAKLLNLSIGTVLSLVEKGELRAWKTGGGHRRIAMQSILEYQKQHNLMGKSEPTQSARLKVLLVEDDAPTRELLKGTIELWNLPLDCTVKTSAMEALIEIASLRPDVLITDLKMPGVDGFEFLRILRSNPSFSGIHLVTITSLSEHEVAERGGLPEHTIYLKKPVDMNWLNGYFTALTATRRAQQGPN
jgi:excisionase family DNA binding protein